MGDEPGDANGTPHRPCVTSATPLRPSLSRDALPARCRPPSRNVACIGREHEARRVVGERARPPRVAHRATRRTRALRPRLRDERERGYGRVEPAKVDGRDGERFRSERTPAKHQEGVHAIAVNVGHESTVRRTKEGAAHQQDRHERRRTRLGDVLGHAPARRARRGVGARIGQASGIRGRGIRERADVLDRAHRRRRRDRQSGVHPNRDPRPPGAPRIRH